MEASAEQDPTSDSKKQETVETAGGSEEFDASRRLLIECIHGRLRKMVLTRHFHSANNPF